MGADVAVTVSQNRTETWGLHFAPCKPSPRGAESFWKGKMAILGFMQAATEATRGSLFNLIHLAVSYPDSC